MKNTTIERTAADSLRLERLREALTSGLNTSSGGESEWPSEWESMRFVALARSCVEGRFAAGFPTALLHYWVMPARTESWLTTSLGTQRANRPSLYRLAAPSRFFIAYPRQRNDLTDAESPALPETEPEYTPWIRQCLPAAAQSIPAEVAAVANWIGVADHVEEVRQFTEDLFPGPVKITAAQDPDIVDDWHIVFRVQASGEIRDILNRQDVWHRRLLSCTRPRSDAFRISIDAR